MTARIVIDAGTALPRDALARMASRLEATFPLLDAVGDGMASNIQSRFETGRGPDGDPWKPSMRALREGGQTLVRDGHLRDSYTHRVQGSEVAVGSQKIYAGVHQFGAVIRAKGGKALRFDLGGNIGEVFVQKVEIPARPVLGIGPDDEAVIREETDAFVLDAIGGDAGGERGR